MSTASAARTNHWESVGLVLLALAPVCWLVLLTKTSTGRDLTALFFAGSAVLFVGGVSTTTAGLQRGRDAWMLSGASCLAFVLASCLLVAGTEAHWVGRTALGVTVAVRDADTGRPLPHAVVRLAKAEQEGEGTPGRTDEAGRAQLTHDVKVAGTSSLVVRTGSLSVVGETLHVEAPGYQSLHEPLGKFTGLEWDLYGPPIPAVEVTLKKLGRP
jgi:hypothetical protein